VGKGGVGGGEPLHAPHLVTALRCTRARVPYTVPTVCLTMSTSLCTHHVSRPSAPQTPSP
jgi:hypothetical protein